MSDRVVALARRAGGTVAEEQVVAQLAARYSLAWARDAVHYALSDGKVFRRYLDGVDALYVADEPRWLPGHGDTETSTVPPDDRSEAEGRGWSL
jgi:hypothetical protein